MRRIFHYYTCCTRARRYVSEPVIVRLVVVRLHLLRLRRSVSTSGGYPLVVTTGRAAKLEP